MSEKAAAINNDAMPDRAWLLEQLARHPAGDQREQWALERTREFASHQSLTTYPANQTGHFTADGWLLSPDRQQVLLTFHHKYQEWIQLGGHVDAGETLIEAAYREVKEESGLIAQLLSPDIFDLDVHQVRSLSNQTHHDHYDVRFLMQADSWEFTISDESDDLRWFHPEEIRNLPGQFNQTLERMVAKWQAFLATGVVQ